LLILAIKWFNTAITDVGWEKGRFGVNGETAEIEQLTFISTYLMQ